MAINESLTKTDLEDLALRRKIADRFYSPWRVLRLKNLDKQNPFSRVERDIENFYQDPTKGDYAKLGLALDTLSGNYHSMLWAAEHFDSKRLGKHAGSIRLYPKVREALASNPNLDAEALSNYISGVKNGEEAEVCAFLELLTKDKLTDEMVTEMLYTVDTYEVPQSVVDTVCRIVRSYYDLDESLPYDWIIKLVKS